MHRLLPAAVLVAAVHFAPVAAEAQEIRPLAAPDVCNIVNNSASQLSECRAALSALIQAEPDNHLARLRLADMNLHLNEYDAVAEDIIAVRSRVGPERFEALIAAQKDFKLAGAADCRVIVHAAESEVRWRGPCAGGYAEGKGALDTYAGRRAWTQATTATGGVIAEGATAWGVEQTIAGSFEYWRQKAGARLRTIRPDEAAPEAKAFLAEAVQAIPTKPMKTRTEGTITANDQQLPRPAAWRFRCYGLLAVAGERFRLTVQTPGRPAVITIQPGDSCSNVPWRFDPRYTREATAGVDAVDLDLTFGGGTYIIAVGSMQPGAFVLTKERLTGAGGVPVPAGPPVVPPEPSGSASTATFKAERTYKTGETIKDCPNCPEMVVLPAGSFMIGSPATEEGRQGAEGPRKRITFKRAFAIGKYEVTFDEWNACVAAGACAAKADNGWGQGRRPVINVDFGDVYAYLGWLTKTTAYNYYLPSEAEWEYAARAGTDTPWSTGDGIITDDANILNAFGRTTPVGGFPANAFGLHDMHGNVAEFVQDCFDVGYFDIPTDGRAKTSSSDGKCFGVMRGGHYESEPAQVRSAARAQVSATGPKLGFRVTRLLD